MIAVDTNILVRFLVRDDEQQAELVRTRFREVEQRTESLVVPLLVVLELIWVLESVYDVPRSKIVDAIEDLLLMPVLQFERVSVVQRFVCSTRDGRGDLADLFIAESAKESGCQSVLTLDKKASRLPLFQLLKGEGTTRQSS